MEQREKKQNIPCLIKNGKKIKLEKTDMKKYVEDDLQELLHNSPEILPIDEFDSAFGPLISIGREINNIDNLYISPNGRITIVEAKLWRSNESSRKVVAQILDYVSQLSTWDLETLEKKCQEVKLDKFRSLDKSQSLFDYVNTTQGTDLEEHVFNDEVEKNLSSGRFLLLIVGDGIKTNIERMLGAMHEHTQKLFTFGLVEIGIYNDIDNGDFSVYVPRVVLKTKEVLRAVVKIDPQIVEKFVSIEAPSEKLIQQKKNSRYTLSAEEFYASFSFENPTYETNIRDILMIAEKEGLFLDFKTASVSVKLKDPRQLFTIFLIDQKTGDFHVGWLYDQLKNWNQETIADKMQTEIANLFDDIEVKKDMSGLSRNITIDELSDKQEEIIAIIKQTVSEIREPN